MTPNHSKKQEGILKAGELYGNALRRLGDEPRAIYSKDNNGTIHMNTTNPEQSKCCSKCQATTEIIEDGSRAEIVGICENEECECHTPTYHQGGSSVEFVPERSLDFRESNYQFPEQCQYHTTVIGSNQCVVCGASVGAYSSELPYRELPIIHKLEQAEQSIIDACNAPADNTAFLNTLSTIRNSQPPEPTAEWEKVLRNEWDKWHNGHLGNLEGILDMFETLLLSVKNADRQRIIGMIEKELAILSKEEHDKACQYMKPRTNDANNYDCSDIHIGYAECLSDMRTILHKLEEEADKK